MVGSIVFLLLTLLFLFFLSSDVLDVFLYAFLLFILLFHLSSSFFSAISTAEKKPITEMIVRAFCVDRTGHGRRWNKRRERKINKYISTNVNSEWRGKNSIDKRKQIERSKNIYVKAEAFDNSLCLGNGTVCWAKIVHSAIRLLQNKRKQIALEFSWSNWTYIYVDSCWSEAEKSEKKTDR